MFSLTQAVGWSDRPVHVSQRPRRFEPPVVWCTASGFGPTCARLSLISPPDPLLKIHLAPNSSFGWCRLLEPCRLPAKRCRKTPTLCQPPWKDLVWSHPGCLFHKIQKTSGMVLSPPKTVEVKRLPRAFCFLPRCLPPHPRFLSRGGVLVLRHAGFRSLAGSIFSFFGAHGASVINLNPARRLSMRW